MSEKSYYVYIVTNKPFGTLYIGITNDLSRRIYEHKMGKGSAFTKKYKLDKLIYFEAFDDPSFAIQREKTLKRWPREWKLTTINNFNSDWADLFETLNH